MEPMRRVQRMIKGAGDPCSLLCGRIASVALAGFRLCTQCEQTALAIAADDSRHISRHRLRRRRRKNVA